MSDRDDSPAGAVPGDVVAVLARTPGVLDALLAGLDDEVVRTNEGGDSWSAFDVVGHLVDGEETDWIPRARIIRAGGGRFEPFDRFRHRERNAGRSMRELLAEFARLRAADLAELRAWELTESDLERTGEHPDFGAVTLRHLLTTWAVHDLGHLAQIARVLAKRHADDIGPWRAYVPVSGDREGSGPYRDASRVVALSSGARPHAPTTEIHDAHAHLSRR